MRPISVPSPTRTDVIPSDSVARSIAEALAGARSVVVGAHVDPDGDAVGSALGLTLACVSIGIAATPVLAGSDAVPSSYAFLPGAARFRTASLLSAPDVFVALDTPSFARLGDAETLARSAGTLIDIDHHPDNGRFGGLCLLDPAAAAVGGMVWDLLPALGVVPDADIATCLYTALLTDTGRFSYRNTTPAALRTAAAMLACGVDVQQVFTDVYESRSAGALALIGRTLERIACCSEGRIAYSWVTDRDFAETGARREETENLIDEVRALGGARVVFLMKAEPGTVRVSLRAKGPHDVGSVARVFGGGGHAAAAGFTFAGDIETLLPKLLPCLEELLP